jgi:hypothetical protein
VDDSGKEFQAIVDAQDPTFVRWLGREGNAYLLRIRGGPEDLNLQPVDDDDCCKPLGEGEASLRAATQTAAQAEVDVDEATAGTASAEGEASLALVSFAPSHSVVDTDNVLDDASPVAKASPSLAEPTSSGEGESTQIPLRTELIDVAWFAETSYLGSRPDAAPTAAEPASLPTPDGSGQPLEAIDLLLAEDDFVSDLTESESLEEISPANSADYALAVDSWMAGEVLQGAV